MELIRSGHRPGPCDGDTGGADKDAAPRFSTSHPWGITMGETRQVLVPDIGDFKDVPIIEIQVKPGDRITAEAPLITLESDKASMEVPSPSAGVVKNIAVKLGDRVSQGAPILTLELDGAGAAAEAAKPAVTAPPAPTSAPAGVAEVRVPDIGDFKDVPIIEVMVKAGDTVKPEQPLVTLESDKASMEVPSPLGGVVQDLKAKIGDRVSEGTVILTLRTDAAAAQAQPAAPAAAASAGETRGTCGRATSRPRQSQLGDGGRHPLCRAIGPKACARARRRLASGEGKRTARPHPAGGRRQFRQGSGRSRRGYAAPGSAAADGAALGLLPWPKIDFTKFGPVETKPLARIKKISGANLHRNWVMIPHVTNHDECDITELEEFRNRLNKENEKSGVRVSMLAFMIKAAVGSLKKFPEFNASLDGDNLILKKYYHIGFAADTPQGLVVPVIRDADHKGVIAIAKEMGDLAKLARDGKLKPDQMQGGTFTISSLGGIGGTYFTPIINAPEVAIMGACRSFQKPVWDDKQFVPRLFQPLSLSWDHRVIDGAAAARFNAHFGSLLTDMRRALV